MQPNDIKNVTKCDEYTECYVVAGGPSLQNFDWNLLNNKFVIAINRSYEVLPAANIVYFTDEDWYEHHRDALLKHTGIKVKGSVIHHKQSEEDGIIQFKLPSSSGLTTTPGHLSHGSNSTYAAINLAAVHLDFKKIYLLGVDMKRSGDKTHWHNGHVNRKDPESIYSIMLKNFASIWQPLRNMGVEVININTDKGTNLRVFPIVPFEEIFDNKKGNDEKTIMNIKLGNPYPAGNLSNLSPHPFVFRGIQCNSMEGLLQSLKFKNPEMQKYICSLVGKKAKLSGASKDWKTTQTLWWQGKPIKRDSEEYQQLLDEAYNELFIQNESARKALIASKDATLTHTIGKRKINDTVLTQQEFCSRLMSIRRNIEVEQHGIE